MVLSIVDAQSSSQTVQVPAQGRTRVVWELQVPLYGAASAQLTFTAEGGGYRDAARPNVGEEDGHALPVYRYESPEVYSTAGRIDHSRARGLRLLLSRRKLDRTAY